MAKFMGFGNADNDEDAGKAVEAKFKTVEDGLKEVKDANAANANTLKSIADSIKAMNDKAAKEEADRKAATDAAAIKKAEENQNAKTPEDIVEELLSDPAAFISKQVNSTTRLALITAGKQVKSEVLTGEEYYHGEIKRATDAMIEAEQNLALRANPTFVKNCYNVAIAQNLEKITSGEIKKFNSLHSFSDSSSGGTKGDDPSAKPKIEFRSQGQYSADKSRFAAQQLGLTDEDIVDAAKTQVIHGLEVVA